MECDEEYRDHDIHVEAFEVRPGFFNWRHTIDTGHMLEGRDRALPSAELAMREGLQEAMVRVDAWIRLQKGR